ncbi:MAG TPA: amidohydrolase [Chloroflexia bacterium]|nr:amidohydrolase [Chloroflexia bacterium]
MTTENPGENGKLNLKLDQEVNRRQEDLIRLRRDFHQHPELSFKEGRTAQIVTDRLQKAGLQVRTGVGQTGVVGILEGGRPGRTVMWRADMDALPLQEDSELLPFHSEVEGVMHACGHDGHTAIALTVADILAQHKKELPGRVVFVFQPGEEVGGGAKAMLQDGLFKEDGPAGGRPDVTLGLHLGSLYPTGVAQIKAGPLMAAVDTLSLTVRGKGGHAATPHLTIDPVVVSCELVVALQTLVSREVPPTSAAVLTFGSIHSGTKDNIIPVEALMMGTLRTFEPEVRRHLLERIAAMSSDLARAFRAEASFRVTESLPAVINDNHIAALVRESAVRAIGANNVQEAVPRMGSEDMSVFMEEVPGCFINIGAARAGDPVRPHHSPLFAIDEGCLEVGVKVASQAILDLLPSK